MPVRYDHVCLTVGDIDRSVRFYEKYFGLQVVRRDKQPARGPMVDRMTQTEGGALQVCFMSDGRFILELLEFVQARGERSAGLPANEVGSPHLAFVVDDVRETHRAWSRDGVRFNCEPIPSRNDTWAVMLRDPDDILIELIEADGMAPEMKARLAELRS